MKDCSFCGVQAARVTQYYEGVEAVACVVCVEMMYGSAVKPPLDLPPPLASVPPEERRATAEAALRKDDSDAEAHADLAQILLESGDEEGAARHFLHASRLHTERGNELTACVLLRQAIAASPVAEDLRERIRELEASLPDADGLAKLTGAIADDGVPVRVMVAPKRELTPIEQTLDDLAKAAGYKCAGVRNFDGHPLPELIERVMGKFPGQHCHLCGQDMDDGMKLYSIIVGDRVACEPCVLLAGERIAAGNPS